MGKFNSIVARAVLAVTGLIAASAVSAQLSDSPDRIVANNGIIDSALDVQLSANLQYSCPIKGRGGRPAFGYCPAGGDLAIYFTTVDEKPLPCYPVDSRTGIAAKPSVATASGIVYWSGPIYTDESGKSLCVIPGAFLRANQAVLSSLLQRGYMATYTGEQGCDGLCTSLMRDSLSATGRITRSGTFPLPRSPR